jgi:hypothetical protein
MTEKKIETGDLQKALQSLQDLAKGHNSRGTATTEVVGMAAESGATQVFHTPSNSDPHSWAGSTWAGEDWSDSIGPDGTDYKAAGAKMRKSILEKISKGVALSQGEKNFVAKGGLDKFKDVDKGMAPPFMKKDDDDKDVEKAAGHSDEAEDKKLITEMMDKKDKKDKMMDKTMDKKDMSKSFTDHAAENSAVRSGFEVSEFLAGFAQVMHKSLASMEARITDRVLTGIAKSDVEQGEVQKSMAEALARLGEVLAAHAQRIEQVESGPARAPKSTLSKSGVAPEQAQELSKSQVTGVLVDLVQKGQASAQDVLKYDATGELSPELRQKVVGRR